MLVSGVWQSDFSYTYTCFTENFLKVTNAGGSTEKILNFTGSYIKPQRSLSVSKKSLKKCLFFFNWIIPLLRIYFKKIILNIEKIHRDVYCSIFLWLQGTGNSLGNKYTGEKSHRICVYLLQGCAHRWRKDKEESNYNTVSTSGSMCPGLSTSGGPWLCSSSLDSVPVCLFQCEHLRDQAGLECWRWVVFVRGPQTSANRARHPGLNPGDSGHFPTAPISPPISHLRSLEMIIFCSSLCIWIFQN